MSKHHHRRADLYREIESLTAELGRVSRDLDELRDGLADEVRTRRIVVADEHHRVEILPSEITVEETNDDGDRCAVRLCADGGATSVELITDEYEPAITLNAISGEVGFGHDPDGRAAAVVAVGDTEIVSYRRFDLDTFRMVDVDELAVPQPAS
jgi:hypothetical protein